MRQKLTAYSLRTSTQRLVENWPKSLSPRFSSSSVPPSSPSLSPGPATLRLTGPCMGWCTVTVIEVCHIIIHDYYILYKGGTTTSRAWTMEFQLTAVKSTVGVI